MNKILLIALLIISNLNAIGQNQFFPNLKKPNVVTTIIYMRNGETMNYHVTETKSNYKNGKEKPQSSIKTEYDIELKITDSTEKTYNYELTYSGFKTENGETDLDNELAKIMEGVTIKFQTDEIGIFDTITNLNELSKTMIESIDVISEKYLNLIKKEEEKKLMKNKLEFMKVVFTQPENMEVAFQEDILSIFSLYGIEMTLNKPQEYEIEFPLLENISLFGKATLTLKTIDKTNNKCNFESIERPDKGEINRFLTTFIGIFFPEIDEKDRKEKIPDIKFNGSTNVNYIMELSSGKMKSIKRKSTSKMNNGKKESKTVSTKEYKLI